MGRRRRRKTNRNIVLYVRSAEADDDHGNVEDAEENDVTSMEIIGCVEILIVAAHGE